MQIEMNILILAVSAIISITYLYILVRLDIITLSHKRMIKDIAEIVQFNLLTRGNSYAKMIEGVLHRDLFQREDYVSLFSVLRYPVFVIFGPDLCWETFRFLRAFKENKNIRLFQFVGTGVQYLPNNEQVKIDIKRRKYCMIVDGVHCFVEVPRAPSEHPKGGWEYESDIRITSEYESNFDSLLKFCKELDRDHIIRSVGVHNIYTVVENKYLPVMALDNWEKLLRKFAKEMGGEELEDLGMEIEKIKQQM